MTPTLQALARAYMALPGFCWARGMRRGDGCVYLGAGLWARESNGEIMTALHSPGMDMDLTDPAAGGVMLDLLGAGWAVYQREHDGFWEMHRPDGEHHQEGATLAEAVARVAVAVGRAG